MAILTPSRSFEGSDLSSSTYGRLIKEGVRTVNFKDDRNKEGNFFFILPPYKLDNSGRGVSWKVFGVRDNFGLDTKELFAVPRNCPVAYFAGRAKRDYPDYTKVEQVNVNGRTMKRYPPYGRVTNKVIFNTAYMNACHLGAHVLTLPQFGGAEHIEAWGRRRMSDGTEAPLLNNPEAAIPVFIQLKKDAVGMPWVVTPEPSKTYKLQAELADASYLYNLDDVVYYPEIEYLIEKLQGFVPADIFNRCMAGYQLPNGRILGSGPTTGVALPATPAPAAPAPSLPASIPQATIPTATIPAQQAAPAVPAAFPAFNIPRATIGAAPTPPVEVVPTIPATNMSNPAASLAQQQYTREEAMAYLNRQRT